jgi:hypothetical protein
MGQIRKRGGVKLDSLLPDGLLFVPISPKIGRTLEPWPTHGEPGTIANDTWYRLAVRKE